MRSRSCAAPAKSGLGSAYRDGFRHGLAHGFDVLVEMDSDLSHDPAALPSILAEVENGADLAIGSRYVAGGFDSELEVASAGAVEVGQPLRGRSCSGRRCGT